MYMDFIYEMYQSLPAEEFDVFYSSYIEALSKEYSLTVKQRRDYEMASNGIEEIANKPRGMTE